MTNANGNPCGCWKIKDFPLLVDLQTKQSSWFKVETAFDTVAFDTVLIFFVLNNLQSLPQTVHQLKTLCRLHLQGKIASEKLRTSE